MKRLQLYYITGVLLAVTFSCQHENYEGAVKIYNEDFGKAIILTGETVNFEYPLMKPRRLLLIDSVLLVYNVNTESLIYKYNLNTFKKMGECISFGNGPGELTDIHNMQRSDSTIWLIDSQRKKCHNYRLSDFCFKDTFKSQHSLSISEAFTDAWVFPDHRVIATGFNSDVQRFSFFSPDGTIQTKGDYPSFGNDLTDLEKIEGFFSEMVVFPITDRIYLFCLATDLLEIYDLEGRLIKRVHGPDHFFPIVQEKRSGDMIKVTSKMYISRDAFLNPVLVDDEIFVLYSGTYFDPESRNLKDQILVYDKEGKPLRRYKLSEKIYHFAIDEENDIIYGLSDFPEFHLLRFRY
jgi:hypothetical protein